MIIISYVAIVQEDSMSSAGAIIRTYAGYMSTQNCSFGHPFSFWSDVAVKSEEYHYVHTNFTITASTYNPKQVSKQDEEMVNLDEMEKHIKVCMQTTRFCYD